jgi:hypothetical protein
MICASIAAILAVYYSMRVAPRTVSGEVFAQLGNGRVVFASAAEVTAFSADSGRGKKWFHYRFLDDERSKALEATHSTTDSPEVKALKQMLFYSRELVALGEVQTMPVSTGGDKSETVCGARGQFQIKLRPGSYWIIAEGRAGDIDGIWAKEVDVPGESRIEFSEGDATFDKPTHE